MFHSPHGTTAAEGSFFRIFDSIRILSSKDDESNAYLYIVYCIVQSIAIKATISVKAQTTEGCCLFCPVISSYTNCLVRFLILILTFRFYWMQLLAIFIAFYIIINHDCNCMIVISENIVKSKLLFSWNNIFWYICYNLLFV